MDISVFEVITHNLIPTSDAMQVTPKVLTSNVPSPISTLAPPSYKDTLMASEPIKQSSVDTFVPDDEIHLGDGDVTRSTVNGLISIVFSERVQALPANSLNLTVVIKLLRCRIGYNTLRTILFDLWKPTNVFRLMDIENDYFLATFKSHADFVKVVSGGPWMLFGHYLVVAPWTVDFLTS
ncbi:hypothetical protein V6N11_054154 [Hibiscus sabdariffa]|uniref:DUF4283 domain-containing protein n=1 Tax=Hibiscus sabdariffa TaxID=183260 RepID=A0ABR2S3X0_9ROSI